VRGEFSTASESSNSPSVTHLASYPSPNQPTISSDEPYNVPMTLTRRQWGALLGASPLLTRAAAQAPPTPPPEQKPEKPDAAVHDVSQRLAEIEVPMDIEPAFRFSA
jgi:hypothetical protein